MKFLIGTLVVLLGLMLPVSAYAWDESDEIETSDDETFYEITYTQCTFRYAESTLSSRAVDCLCDRLATHAVKWRGKANAPAIADSAEASCLQRR